MSKVEQLLSQYAAYHLDQRNIYTHFVGIPMIVFSVFCFAAKPGVMLGHFDFTLTLFIMILSLAFYYSLDRKFAFLMTFLFTLGYPFAYVASQLPTATWLMISSGFFVVGWIIQLVGHVFERKKPAFIDDLMGLAIGPLFVLAEMVFMLGYRKEMKQRILEQARALRLEMQQDTMIFETLENP